MKCKNFSPFFLSIFLLAACSAPENLPPPTANFVTAVLPTPFAPLPTAALPAATPEINSTPTQILLVEGTTTTQVNVRAQPSKEGAALGMLGIFTKVQIVRKNPSGEWYQIVYADSFGWVSAAYVQVDAGNAIPLLAADTPTPAPMIVPPTESFPVAMQDGDSMQSPLASVIFSLTGARILQLNGDISAPNGDVEDWLQFTAQHQKISIRMVCAGSALNVELWHDGVRADSFALDCGSKTVADIEAGQVYFMRLSLNNGGLQYLPYIVYIESVP